MVLLVMYQIFFSKEKLDNLIANFWLDVQIDYTWKAFPDRNWNELWEKHFFEAIVVDSKCIVYSSFHRIEDEYLYPIIINPKMAFGMGHHQTTYLMLHEIFAMSFTRKAVLDIGCGTAVLAIWASMRRAKSLVAIGC